MESGELVSRLRRAGCVFAEEEARLLRGAARDAAELERLCTRREAGEFLEHVVGSVELMGERLAVRPGVFVPRQRKIGRAHVELQSRGQLVCRLLLEKKSRGS